MPLSVAPLRTKSIHTLVPKLPSDGSQPPQCHCLLHHCGQKVYIHWCPSCLRMEASHRNAIVCCTIADKKYTYIGAQVAFGWKPATAMPLSAESKTLTQQASLAELDLIWAFLCSHSLYENSRLLLPARFYGFRACSRPALEEKISAGRVYVTFNGHPTPSGTEDARECVGIFCTFDSDLNHGAALMRWHTCCLADGLSVEQIIAVLHAWTAQIPALDEAGSAITAHVLSVGPEPNDESKPDVAPVMQEALDAVGFSRNLPTHLRLYRYE